MSTKYLIQITKDTVVELDSDYEAQQVADMLADREATKSMLGLVSTIKSNYRILSNV
jgi:hypothetical protein